MRPGRKRTVGARLLAMGGCLCGVNGLLLDSTGSGGGAVSIEWVASGILLLLLAVFLLLNGAVAFEKSPEAPGPKP